MFVHRQIPFITLSGEWCCVDVGVFDILTELKAHGVVTQFSCQGGDEYEKNVPQAAYVMADTKSFLPLLKKIKRLYKKGNLSKESSMLVSKFLHGDITTDFEIAFKRGTYRVFYWAFKHMPLSDTKYSIERHFQYPEGLRTTVRWPHDVSDQVLNLLREVK